MTEQSMVERMARAMGKPTGLGSYGDRESRAEACENLREACEALWPLVRRAAVVSRRYRGGRRLLLAMIDEAAKG